METASQIQFWGGSKCLFEIEANLVAQIRQQNIFGGQSLLSMQFGAEEGSAVCSTDVSSKIQYITPLRSPRVC